MEGEYISSMGVIFKQKKEKNNLKGPKYRDINEKNK